MPKIIKDLEKNIKKSAMELFIDYGYEQVDMKMISKKSGIAVGTLYNYYKSKKLLYMDILEESWQSTFFDLDEISSLTTIPSKEKIKKLITTLYEDTETRNGLGKYFLGNSPFELNEDENFNNLKNNLLTKVKNIISSVSKIETLSKCNNVDVMLTESLLLLILTTFQLHPENKNDNINFLVEFINLSIK
ncbi:TetR/AcrR family transcriptional regulator [Clostridium tagluense]|uniref:TetR/AcrR family transcriptional regulator n=1 Tax=Clostridium tagluense TaxID=360422 RepID=UPI001CF492BD|nr:TetR/AcrR family transcriptional regulator [Clostridium tagluense]MCB2311794.1 TetR/AcrR family transcriptional regulator [Clostridium tagluense]MCB2316484.1 TetR/AcrR family transcriptional regulator [Clostridium tagluense]MCB2321374.1 TetR/AcrR family transcriptional regulator [Clostridium tagluense]MCB2326353.1 TetR/AcrR family transcriptional regulator [Clostridium tagluense]MCB2331076.1 TetR/AcrR family transcriptional regulator [Clostridium tagluense]